MIDSPALYLGKVVSKNNFRVFIYAANGNQKLVESWDEYQNHMQTGLWFAKKPDANFVTPIMDDVEAITFVPIEKPKRKKKMNSMVFEVTDETE
jgi:hypothetical protein